MEPDALIPCSNRTIPSTACSEHITRGSTAGGGAGAGTETLVVVPVDTMTRPWPAPAPTTSQGRSPAPSATGVPAGMPSAAAASAATRWGADAEGYTGGNAELAMPAYAHASGHHARVLMSRRSVRDASV